MKFDIYQLLFQLELIWSS